MVAFLSVKIKVLRIASPFCQMSILQVNKTKSRFNVKKLANEKLVGILN